MTRIKFAFLLAALLLCATSSAQIGERRSELAIGAGAGYVMSNVGFTPDVPQKNLAGMTIGLSVRYTSEKYFKSVCALVGELNIVQGGWREDILTVDNTPVVNPQTGIAEEYQRRLTYLQMPVMMRLGWGRERKGFQFYFQAGPQIGYLLGDKATRNFAHAERNWNDRVGPMRDAAMDSMSIERKFDYGITAALGLEFSHRRLGHFMVEGRYYYGLGDIFNNSKRDYFGRSNNNMIVVKLSWLYDIKKTDNPKIK